MADISEAVRDDRPQYLHIPSFRLEKGLRGGYRIPVAYVVDTVISDQISGEIIRLMVENPDMLFRIETGDTDEPPYSKTMCIRWSPKI
jgi:hypothetical protein